MADSGWCSGDCTLPPTRGWFGSMEPSKVVPACHDMLLGVRVGCVPMSLSRAGCEVGDEVEATFGDSFRGEVG